MSTSTKDIAMLLADQVFTSLGKAVATREEIASAMELELRNVVSHANWMFLPNSNPVQKTCDMPHNKHQFTDKGQGKHCTRCNLDFCDRHNIGHCVVCGAVL